MIPDEYPGSRILWENALRTNKVMYDGNKPVCSLPSSSYPVISISEADELIYRRERAYLLALWEELGIKNERLNNLKEQYNNKGHMRYGREEDGFDRLLTRIIIEDDLEIEGGFD